MNRLLRIRLWWLRLRECRSFIWAHKPLCRRFQPDLLRIGGLHLCRSCTCLHLGILAGLAGAILLPTGLGSGFITAWGVTTTLICLLSMPPLYHKIHRRLRDLLRGSAGLLMGSAPVLCLRGHPWLGGATLLVMALFCLLYARGRPARKLAECDNCPDRRPGAICPGFTRQAEHIRRFEKRATDLLMASGYRPPLPAAGRPGRVATGSGKRPLAS